MIALVFAVVLAVVNDGTSWKINVTPHRENVAVSIFQQCWLNNKLVWQNVSLVHVNPDDNEVLTHRETRGIPTGAACNANFQVVRNPEGGVGDPEKDYDAVGESANITWTQH
jgi:hypothetical protein